MKEIYFFKLKQLCQGTFRSAYWHGIQVAVKTLGDDFLDDEDKVWVYAMILIDLAINPVLITFIDGYFCFFFQFYVLFAEKHLGMNLHCYKKSVIQM